MRTFILTFIGACLLLVAFDAKKCDHVFTVVVQPEVEGSYFLTYGEHNPIGRVGKHEGPEIICVKCFHRQKQIVTYAPPIIGDVKFDATSKAVYAY